MADCKPIGDLQAQLHEPVIRTCPTLALLTLVTAL